MDTSKKSYCRLCAELKPNNKLSNLHTDAVKLEAILEKLTRLNLNLDFMDNNLPKAVCIPCFRALTAAYEFVEGIEKAQTVLQDIFFLKPEIDSVDVCYENFDKKYESSDSEACLNIADISVKTECTQIQNAEHINNTECLYEDNNRNWQDYTWMCSCCETLFQTAEELQTHSMELHSKCNAYRCTDCGKRRHDLNGFIKHICTHKKHLKLSCHRCFETFPMICKLQAHRRIHMNTEFVCIGCNTCFTSEESLEIHKKKYYAFIRTNKQSHNSGTCKICNKTFKNLSVHMLTHRDRTRDHTCEKCGRSYFTKEGLEQHYITHSADKPYECKICKQSFKTETYLRCHVVIHNDIKPYTCDICKKSYHRLKELNHHKKIHTDTWYECNICNKRYKLKKQLTLHLKLHNGIMPYSCEACQWNFTNYTNYFKHMRGKHNTDIRKKKYNSTDESALEWKEEFINKKPLKRKRKHIREKISD